MRPDEDEEDRREDRHGFLHAAEVQDDQEDEDDDLDRQLVAGHRRREEVPDLVAAGRDGHRDREDVVDEERAARDDAGPLSEELRRHEVAASPAREVLDEVRVGERNDAHRDGGHRDQDDREGAMLPERAERLVRTVRGRREAVGSQPDPREERDEREPVEDVRVLDVARLPEENAGELAWFGHRASETPAGESRDSPLPGVDVFITSLGLSPDFLRPQAQIMIHERDPRLAWRILGGPSGRPRVPVDRLPRRRRDPRGCATRPSAGPVRGRGVRRVRLLFRARARRARPAALGSFIIGA